MRACSDFPSPATSTADLTAARPERVPANPVSDVVPTRRSPNPATMLPARLRPESATAIETTVVTRAIKATIPATIPKPPQLLSIPIMAADHSAKLAGATPGDAAAPSSFDQEVEPARRSPAVTSRVRYGPHVSEDVSPSNPDGAPSFLSRATEAVMGPPIAFLDEIGSTVTLAFRAFTWLFRPPFRFTQILGAIEFIGAGSMFIAGLVGLFTGMAFTVSVIVGFRQFSAEGMVGGVVALALARELAPVLAAVVVTARAGSTMASELGNMRVSEQIDAITTMGVSPVQYLVMPRILATTLVLPLLGILFGLSGMAGAYLVAVVWQSIDPGIFLERIHTFVQLSDIRMLLVKSALFGLVVSTICCNKGFFASGGARGVGEATAKAVVASIVAIFACDYVTTAIMTDI